MQTKQITRLIADEGKYLRKDNQFYKTVDLKDNETASDYEEIAEKVMKKYYAQMTPREFILGLLSRGITREQIENLISANEQVWAELNYATYIERKNPLLDQLCGQFGLTEEDVDGIFGLN